MAIVTISRGTYTGGIAVAEALAAELGHPCVSREVVRDAAQESGVAEVSLQATLEEPPRFWQTTPGTIPAHLNLVRTALLKRAQGGDLVYHGYAGHLLLRGVPHVLRARIIADDASRVAAAMRDKGLTEKQAVEFVRKLDVQLAKWTRFLYGVDWQDPGLYDVVLNLEHVSVKEAAATLAAMTRLAAFQPTPQARKAFADLLLSSTVWAALTADPRTRSANIRVAADDGAVFISGSAGNERVLRAVTELAAQVPGVTGVTSEAGVGAHWQW
jgi:osmotically-inducible protein OsmY